MPQEITLEDFSGGMNASVAVDKMDAKECLLAESVRFDEAGNAIISGANTAQNTSGLGGSVHSLFYDSALGCIAGVGTSVLVGPTPASLSTSTVTNPTSAKASFGIAPNRIYFDLGGMGYWQGAGQTAPLTVDYPPPSVASGNVTVTGPNSPGAVTQIGTAGAAWSGTGGLIGTSSFASVSLSTATLASRYLLATNFGFALNTSSAMQGIQVTVAAKITGASASGQVFISLVRGGTTVGTQKSVVISPSAGLVTYTFGGSTDLWGISSIVATDVNASGFGFQLSATENVFVSAIISAQNGQITVWQSPGGIIAGTASGPGVLTGTYSWKVAFTGPSGEESQASLPTNTLTFTSANGTLTGIPTGDMRTGGRNVYRKGGTLTSYYLVGAIPDNSSTTFLDTITDLAALTTAVILAGDTVGDEPNTRLGSTVVKYPTLHYERTFWASGNMLIWSKPLNGFAYPVDFSTPVGDSKVITGIISQGGELIVFKPDGIWQMTGTDENSFQLSKTLSAVGTDWPFTIVAAGGSTSGFYFTGRIIFANRQGIWAFNGYNSSKISQKLDLWFRQDDRTGVSLQGVNGFHPPEITNSAVTGVFQAAASNAFYRLAYAEAGQSANNAMLVLDLERGNITKRAFAAPSMAVESVSGYFYAGTPTGFIVQLDDWNATNNGLGAAVNFDFQTKYNDLKLRGSKFAVWGIEFLINTGGQTVTPSVYFDEGTGTSETLGTISVSQPTRVFRKLAGISSRSCRNFSVRLNASTSSVNSSGKPNIQLNHLKIYFEPRLARARTGE